MPKGKAPYPKKSTVDAGRADKAKAVRGGYERTEKTNEAYGRKITYPKTGTMTKVPAPSGTNSTAPSTTANIKYKTKKK